MTIEKGAAWGSVAMTPFDTVVAPDEESAARAVKRGARHVVLASGDLLRALGTGADATMPVKGRPSLQLPCDVLHVRLDDGEPIVAVSKVLIGSRLHPRVWITTGGFIGHLNVAPRAHPNDGLIDALEFARDLAPRELLAIRRRMRLGDHLPHPRLTMHRDKEHLFRASSREPVTIDGRRYGRAKHVHVTVQPDTYVLCIANVALG